MREEGDGMTTEERIMRHVRARTVVQIGERRFRMVTAAAAEVFLVEERPDATS